MSKRKMHLLGHLCTGPTAHHSGAWRHPDSDVDVLLSPSRYERMARLYERGLFDGVFIVDYHSIPRFEAGTSSSTVRLGGQMAMLDPLLVLSVMSRVTERVGLAATMSTTLNAPYSIARSLATLDHLSGGRAGWNIVTSTQDAEARNHGIDSLPAKDVRYDMADEVVEACLALWDTWAEDALVLRRDQGRFADPSKVRFVEYEGSTVRVSGGLATPHMPQGRPVMMQAGGSERGRAFAARWAEVIFTRQQAKPLMQDFYAGIKGLMTDVYGRRPQDCAVLPSVEVFVDRSPGAAAELAAELDSLIDPALGLEHVGRSLGRPDIADVPLDTPLSRIEVGPQGPPTEGSYLNLLGARKDGRELTLGEAAVLNAATWASPRLVGDAASVVDEMEDLFMAGACDGFVITSALSPRMLENFVGLVVPELQRRGLYRSEYTETTFRGHLRS